MQFTYPIITDRIAQQSSEGNVFTGVCHSVHRVLTIPPWKHPLDTPPTPLDTPRLPGHATTPGHTPPYPAPIRQDTVNLRSVRILLECILVLLKFIRNMYNFSLPCDF